MLLVDDVTADKSRKMNSEVFQAILSAHNQPNASELISSPLWWCMEPNGENCVNVLIYTDVTECLKSTLVSFMYENAHTGCTSKVVRE